MTDQAAPPRPTVEQMFTPDNKSLIHIWIMGPLTVDLYRFLAEYCTWKADAMERRQRAQGKADDAPPAQEGQS